MKTILIIITLLTTLGITAQNKVSYPKFTGNAFNILYIGGEDSIEYAKFHDEVKTKLLPLEGKWQADEDANFILDLRLYEKDGHPPFDRLAAYGIEHPEFDLLPYKLRLCPFDTTNLDLFSARFNYDATIKEILDANANEYPVSGMVMVIDENTFFLFIMGCFDPGRPGEEIYYSPDYHIKSAPSNVLERVNEVFKRNNHFYTFRRL